jgi:fructokinase
VRATLDARGLASYEIAERVAWDCIGVPKTLRKTPAPKAIVYGSLALRRTSNRVALMDLVAAWPGALRVLDLNLRAPFDRGSGVRFALSYAHFIKLNDDELERMTGQPVRAKGQLESAARVFAKEHGVARICVTAGARGAGLLWADDWHWEDARPVTVRDTVGAGDAFLAALVACRLGLEMSPDEALSKACRMGEFVAARDGATPPYRCDSAGRPHETSS